MNGHFLRAYFTFEPSGGSPPLLYRGSDWKRLSAALVASVLLHAALVSMPSLGTSTTGSRPVARGALKPGASRILDVRLKQARESAGALAGKTAAAGDAAGSAPRPKASEEPGAASNRLRGADLLPLPAPTYYTVDQLTKPPQPTAQPDLIVPRRTARFVSGKVVLNLWIDELGNVDSVEVESSSLPETISGAATAAFGKLRFVPGEIDGRRVRALVRIEVVYQKGKRPPP